MSEFKVIETQEELDRIIGDRLARERAKYEDYDDLKKAKSDLESQVGQLQSTIEESNKSLKANDATVAELNKKIAGYEKASLRTKIALQNGLPIDLADRLVGDDEESIKADAERLAGFVAKPKVPPLKDPENTNNKDKTGWSQLARDLTNKGE